MKYALNLDKDNGNHILSACVVLPNGNYDDMPIVDELPDGDITDYRWNGEFIHDPLPQPEQPEAEASADDILNALLGVTL